MTSSCCWCVQSWRRVGAARRCMWTCGEEGPRKKSVPPLLPDDKQLLLGEGGGRIRQKLQRTSRRHRQGGGRQDPTEAAENEQEAQT
eukprot:182327-Chlamydomonas_euryale.AAC.3